MDGDSGRLAIVNERENETVLGVGRNGNVWRNCNDAAAVVVAAAVAVYVFAFSTIAHPPIHSVGSGSHPRHWNQRTPSRHRHRHPRLMMPSRRLLLVHSSVTVRIVPRPVRDHSPVSNVSVSGSAIDRHSRRRPKSDDYHSEQSERERERRDSEMRRDKTW